MKNLLDKLPSKIAESVMKTEGYAGKITEISLRGEKNTVIKADNRYIRLGCTTSFAEIALTMQKLCEMSVYAYIDEIRNGFITVKGGHRVGVCGTAVVKEGKITNIKNISSLNIRVAHEVKRCSDNIKLDFKSLLIISPPGCGKTTILRDLCRRIGQTKKVSVIDERGEIAAVFNGQPEFDLGDMTDVMSLCDKAQGIEYMLRSMSPDLIVTDEIARKDSDAIRKSLSYGVGIAASVHGDDIRGTLRRLGFERGNEVFDKILLLSNKNGIGTIEKMVKGVSLYG